VVTTVLPILLIGLGGFLVGGVISLWRRSVPAAVVLGVFAMGCVIGGIVWLL
jgi:hypothetical protein